MCVCVLTLLTGGAIDSKLFNHIHGYGLCNQPHPVMNTIRPGIGVHRTEEQGGAS